MYHESAFLRNRKTCIGKVTKFKLFGITNGLSLGTSLGYVLG